MQLEKKTAIVTGGGSGFGAGIADLFSKNGATVIVADINIENATKVANHITVFGSSGCVRCRKRKSYENHLNKRK